MCSCCKFQVCALRWRVLKFYWCANVHQFEKFFQIRLPHADTAVRPGLACGVRRVRAMNSVALEAEAYPARAQGIVAARCYDQTVYVTGGIHQAADDLVLARRRRRGRFAYGNVVRLNGSPIQEERRFFIGDGNDDQIRSALVRLSSPYNSLTVKRMRAASWAVACI